MDFKQRLIRLDDLEAIEKHLADPNAIKLKDGSSGGDFISFRWDAMCEGQERGDLIGMLLTKEVGGADIPAALYVAEVDEITKEAWLSMLRVNPEFRQQGLATQVWAKLSRELAAKNPGQAARLAVTSTNKNMLTLCAKLGMHEEYRSYRWGVELAVAAKSDMQLPAGCTYEALPKSVSDETLQRLAELCDIGKADTGEILQGRSTGMPFRLHALQTHHIPLLCKLSDVFVLRDRHGLIMAAVQHSMVLESDGKIGNRTPGNYLYLGARLGTIQWQQLAIHSAMRVARDRGYTGVEGSFPESLSGALLSLGWERGSKTAMCMMSYVPGRLRSLL